MSIIIIIFVRNLYITTKSSHMRQSILFLIPLLTISLQAKTQTCDNYPCVIAKVKNALKIKSYQIALDNLESADGYADKNIFEIKNLRRVVFEAIEYEKNEAKLQKDRAEKTLVRVDSLRKVADRERDQTKAALKTLEKALKDLENANINQVRLILAEANRNIHELKFETAISKLRFAQVLKALPDSVEIAFKSVSNALLENAKQNTENLDFQSSLLNIGLAEELNVSPEEVATTYRLIQLSLLKQINKNILDNNYILALETNHLLNSIKKSKDTMLSNYFEIAFCFLETGQTDQAISVFNTMSLLMNNVNISSRLQAIAQLEETNKYPELRKLRADLDPKNNQRCIDRYFPRNMLPILVEATLGDKQSRNNSTSIPQSISNFKLANKELTFFEYDLFCAATMRKKPLDNGWGRGRMPLIDISWYDAIEYCNWRSQQEGLQKVYTLEKRSLSSYDSLSRSWTVTYNNNANGYRLPNANEWEFAAGNGPNSSKYSWGSQSPAPEKGGNVADSSLKLKFPKWEIFPDYSDGFTFTAPVGSFAPNEFGLYDMSGNVWEWCWNKVNEAPFFKKVELISEEERVLVGCAWSSSPKDCAVSTRFSNHPASHNFSIGFRLAQN